MLTRDDSDSILRKPLKPRADIAGPDGRMTFADLIKFARVER